MPRFAHTLSVSAPPAAIFEIVDDFTKTPLWLSRCTGIDKLSDGPNDVGTALLTGLGFALGRAVTPALRYASRAGEEWDDRLQDRLPLLAVGGGAVLAAALVVLTLRGFPAP